MRTAIGLWVLLGLILHAGPGCALQRVQILPTDGGGLDGGAADAPLMPGVDGGVDTGTDVPLLDGGGVDAGVLDTGVDAGMRDAGMPDAGMRDAGLDAPARRTCAEIFSSVRNYSECGGSPTTDAQCAFFADPSGAASCTELCEGAGATCIDAWDNQDNGDNRCVRGTIDYDCEHEFGDMICVCTRP